MRELYWNSPRTEALLARLGPIPHRHGLTPVVGAVRVSDYADLLNNSVEQLMMCGYNCALYPVIISVLQAFPRERIKWVFEEQSQHEAAARTVFERFTEFNCQERLSGVEFVSKGSTILTQPADYLSYATVQYLRDSTSKKAQWCKPIRTTVRPLGMIVDRETIRKIIGFTSSAAALQTLLETGKTADEIAIGYDSKGKVSRAIERIRDERKH
jgi:hypothetical protein